MGVSSSKDTRRENEMEFPSMSAGPSYGSLGKRLIGIEVFVTPEEIKKAHNEIEKIRARNILPSNSLTEDMSDSDQEGESKSVAFGSAKGKQKVTSEMRTFPHNEYEPTRSVFFSSRSEAEIPHSVNIGMAVLECAKKARGGMAATRSEHFGVPPQVMECIEELKKRVEENNPSIDRKKYLDIESFYYPIMNLIELTLHYQEEIEDKIEDNPHKKNFIKQMSTAWGNFRPQEGLPYMSDLGSRYFEDLISITAYWDAELKSLVKTKEMLNDLREKHILQLQNAMKTVPELANLAQEDLEEWKREKEADRTYEVLCYYANKFGIPISEEFKEFTEEFNTSSDFSVESMDSEKNTRFTKI